MTTRTRLTSPADVATALREPVGRLLAADRRLRGRDQQRRSGTLSYAHVRALFVLMEEHEATAGTVAKAAELNPASVTAMMDQLEANGLVQRRRDANDRRQCWISLTDAGRAQVEEKDRRWQSRLAAAFADVSDEEVAAAVKVIDLMSSVIEGLADTTDTDTPADQPQPPAP